MTDPLGRSVGFDPATNSVVNTIPYAKLSDLGTEPENITIPWPLKGIYHIQLIGTADGPYTLNVTLFTDSSTYTTQTFTGTISQQEKRYYSAQISETGEMTAISWEHVFQDSKRGTMLKISTDDKDFQFVASDKDFGVKHDPNMKVFNHVITIRYEDNEIRLVAIAVDDSIDFCSALAWDRQTRKIYLLIDEPNW
jgi:hypothetical protein